MGIGGGVVVRVPVVGRAARVRVCVRLCVGVRVLRVGMRVQMQVRRRRRGGGGGGGGRGRGRSSRSVTGGEVLILRELRVLREVRVRAFPGRA